MHILIGVDGSQAASLACQFVANRTWPIGTRVELLAVGSWAGGAPAEDSRVELETLETVLDERAEILRRTGLGVATDVVPGPPADALMARAADSLADLLVVGNRGLGPLGSAVFGSVSAHLVDHARCPVLVVRSPDASRMLLATDGTASSRSIPRVLAAWGPAFRGMPVEVVSVAPRDDFVTPWSVAGDAGNGAEARELAMHTEIAQRVADQMLDLGWHAAAIAPRGDPGRTILTASEEWQADLIVTGSRSLGTIQRLLLGSVAHHVVMHARSSVLVMRGLVPARTTEPAAVAARLAFG
jgi:nucleotide-binding universal stress UspA family protein